MGMWDALLGGGGRNKGTGAYSGTDETFRGMFGRDQTKAPPGGKGPKQFADTSAPVEYQGRTMFPIMENDKGGPRATGYYIPAEEVNDLQAGKVAPGENRADRLVYIPPNERSGLKKPQNPEDDQAGDRAGGPLASLAY